MAQQPLTPAGVQAKKNELYALSDTDLSQQADLIASDFKSWITANFSLTQAQSAFLNTIDAQWWQDASADTSSAIKKRFDITLTAQTQPPSFISKMVDHSYSIISEFDSNNGYSVSGSLGFGISYT